MLKIQALLIVFILQAADYLNVKGLLDVTCKTVAKMIKGKTLEEIRQTFQIRNDFSPDEEQRVRKQYVWSKKENFLAPLEQTPPQIKLFCTSSNCTSSNKVQK